MTEHAAPSCAHGHECRSAPHAPHLPAVVVRSPDPAPVTAPLSWWRQAIAYLRRWSGDDAYERYLAEHQGHGHDLLDRREFYKRYLDKRAGGSRCC